MSEDSIPAIGKFSILFVVVAVSFVVMNVLMGGFPTLLLVVVAGLSLLVALQYGFGRLIGVYGPRAKVQPDVQDAPEWQDPSGRSL